MIKVTESPEETKHLAGFLLKKILKTTSKKAGVIALEGELGAGKTVFTKGFAEALGIKHKIKSPTFTLMKKYPISSLSNFQFPISNFQFLYHFDCYRLKDHKDLEVMGIKEILNNPGNIVLIEWAERVRKILPKKHIKVHIDHISENKRKITIK